MLQNSNLVLSLASSISLLPFLSFHVPQYHEWMKSEELLLLTASEPLSLEEEFKMQQSWAEDESKCTFIVHYNGIQAGNTQRELPIATFERFGMMIGILLM